jgi:hypothetical protein
MAKAKQIIALSAPVAIEAAAVEGDKKSPAKFVSTFYTGGALSISGWDMPVVVDLAGLTNGKVLVANLDHDASKRVGNFSVANDGRSLVANGTATAHTAAREEVVQSAADGYQHLPQTGGLTEQVAAQNPVDPLTEETVAADTHPLP